MKKFIVLVVVLGTFFFGCKHEIVNPGGNNPVDSTPITTGVCFQRDILPIFVSNCAKSGCHDVNSRKEGYVLNNYANIRSKGIKPGNANGSEIYESLIKTDIGDRMPQAPNPALTATQIAMIKKWIDEGAKNTVNCITACDPNTFTYAAVIKPIIDVNCVGCHNSSSAGGGYSFSNYAGLKASVTSGRLLGTINHSGGFSAMPQGGAKLSDCKIQQITKWVNAGAPNN